MPERKPTRTADLDYFYGQSSELFSFYRIPKLLFQDSRFQPLSTDTKTLYGILLDRMSLSARNGWLDKAGRVFIIYTVQEVQDSLGCADKKATKLLRELEEYGLIERKRRGLGKPDLIYVKNFSSESSKLRFLNRDNDDSGVVQNTLQDPAKLRCNKTERNNTEVSDTDPIYSDLDAIEHDPWQLTSFLTTLYDDYTRSEVQTKLKETFAKQYKLTTWVEVQTRYRTVVMIDIFTGIPYTVQVPYEYRIFHTKLVNKGLEVVIREELDNDQWKRYEIFQDTLGGRPYLFKGGLPPGGSDGSGAPGIDYQVPAEALMDEEFAAIYKEAQKYVGTPYVWGGSTPETGFDCSGYVCWVYNQNGYDVGRTTANGLWNKSQHISEAEAKPGDLVFFEGTYDTPGKSHVGIYLGNGMMVSAGDPIKYANIHSSYWQKYLSGFGRLSK